MLCPCCWVCRLDTFWRLVRVSCRGGLLVRELNEPWINFPHRVVSGLSFRFSLLAPFLIASLTAGLKMVGDLTLCQKINDADWKRTNMKSASGGLLASGLGTFFSGLSGGVAQTTVSSCIGLSLATGTTSRSLGFRQESTIAALAPQARGRFGGNASSCCWGHSDLLGMFHRSGRHATFDLAHVGLPAHLCSRHFLLFGLSVDMAPELYRTIPEVLHPLFSSSTALATVLVVSLSLLFRLGIARRVSLEVVPGDDMEKIDSTMEEQGAAWGMRREVVISAVQAVHETVNSALAFNRTRTVQVSIEFDEFKLAADLEYEGVPIQLAESVPSLESLNAPLGCRTSIDLYDSEVCRSCTHQLTGEPAVSS